MSTPPTAPTLSTRLRYMAERLLSSGILAQVGVLALISSVIIGLTVAFLVLWDISPDGVHHFNSWEALWVTIAHTLDGGTMGNDPPDWPFRVVMLLVTLLGLLLVSALIGLLTTGLVTTLDEMRRGRSFVMEEDHTLILGWSPSVFTILSELAIANAGRRRPRIVLLADKDKVEMETEIRAKAPRLGRTKVICRTGVPIDLDDLEIVNPNGARSIIILAPESGDADTHVLKTILALINRPGRKVGKYHIVAELRDAKKREVAKLVGGDEVEVLLASEVVTRLTVQTCFQSGLSIVYTELFDFDGDEIYTHLERSLAGKTYADALKAYDESAVIGLRFAAGGIALNPPVDTVLGVGDHLFTIAKDARSIKLSPQAAAAVDLDAVMVGARKPAAGPRRTLILAWNHRVPAIIREMDFYVLEGSEVTVVADIPEPNDELNALRPLLQNQNVTFWRGDTTDRNTLESLDIYTYQHIIVMGYTELLGQEEADARTLVTLLYLRTLVEQTQAKVNIVSEMLNIRNRELAKVTKVDDFIVSNKLISLMLAQVSENKHLNAVFADLLDAEGMEIYLKPAADYVRIGAPVNFYTVVEAALRRGETAIGYRHMAAEHRQGPMDGVVVNPKKSVPVTYGPDDRIIVVAES